MCFVIQHRAGNKSKKTASKDITCYKVLEIRGFNHLPNIYLSPYYQMSYYFKKIKLYKVKNFTYRISELGCLKGIESGLHTYSTLDKAKLRLKVIVMEVGSPDARFVIVEMVIPKGTKYYYNSNVNEYVSLGLKYVGDIHINKDKK